MFLFVVIHGNKKNACDIQVVHLVCKINMVGLTSIIEGKNVLKKEQNDECIKRAGKIWYNFIIHVMIEILFKVKLFISSFIS